MTDAKADRGQTRAPDLRAEQRRALEVLRRARRSSGTIDTSVEVLRDRVRRLEQEIQRLRRRPRDGAA
jgi:hypothetical protein